MSEIAFVRRQPSLWWGAMIICGTVVGAGMFTLPVVMAGAWYGWSTLILIISWGCMLMTGLMFQRVSYHYPIDAGYDTITRDLLGNAWAAVNGLSLVFVLGVLTYAYISASGPVYQHSLNRAGIPVSSAGAKVTLTIFVAAVVWLGTCGIGRLMTALLIAKMMLMAIFFGGLLKSANVHLLFTEAETGYSYWPYALGILPFCLASFGYHGNISGLIGYYAGDHQRVRKALFIGTGMAFIVYLFWITGTMGNLPREAFPNIIRQGGDIEALMQALNRTLHTANLSFILSLFSHFAVICSFLGVAAGLVDYIADRLNIAKTPIGRLKAVCLTFLPPLSASLWVPDGFVGAIGYAGLFATLWAVIIPGLLFYQLKVKSLPASGFCMRDKMMLMIISLFAMSNIVSWLLNKLQVLPVFK